MKRLSLRIISPFTDNNDDSQARSSYDGMKLHPNFLIKYNSDKHATFSKNLAAISEVIRLQHTGV